MRHAFGQAGRVRAGDRCRWWWSAVIAGRLRRGDAAVRSRAAVHRERHAPGEQDSAPASAVASPAALGLRSRRGAPASRQGDVLVDAGAERRAGAARRPGPRSRSQSAAAAPSRPVCRIPDHGALLGHRLRERDRHGVTPRSRSRWLGGAASRRSEGACRPPTAVSASRARSVRALPGCTRPERRGRERREEIVERGAEVGDFRHLVRDEGPGRRRVVAGRIESVPRYRPPRRPSVSGISSPRGSSPDRERVVPASSATAPALSRARNCQSP